MTIRATRLAIALGALAAARMPAQSGGDPGIAVVERAARAYQALSSFEATFHQHFDDKMVQMVDGKGTLYQEGTNHFAMRFTDPPRDAIVSDGRYLWVYTPSETPGQVMRYQLQDHPTYGSNLLGTFLDDATDRYRITYVTSESIDGHMTDAVLMEPIGTDLPFRRATIWFDRETNMPRKLEIEESRDTKRILQLSQIRINPSIPPATFVCHPPSGTKVVAQ